MDKLDSIGSNTPAQDSVSSKKLETDSLQESVMSEDEPDNVINISELSENDSELI